MDQRARLDMSRADPSQLQLLTSTTFCRWSMRVHDALRAGPLWVPFVHEVGLLMDFRCPAAPSSIVASGAAAGMQVGAAVPHTFVTPAFVEVPLASQLAAPAPTGEAMSQVHSWVKAHRRQVFALVVALPGVFLMATGMGHA